MGICLAHPQPRPRPRTQRHVTTASSPPPLRSHDNAPAEAKESDGAAPGERECALYVWRWRNFRIGFCWRSQFFRIGNPGVGGILPSLPVPYAIACAFVQTIHAFAFAYVATQYAPHLPRELSALRTTTPNNTDALAPCPHHRPRLCPTS